MPDQLNSMTERKPLRIETRQGRFSVVAFPFGVLVTLIGKSNKQASAFQM
jgi:hypothetical protein